MRTVKVTIEKELVMPSSWAMFTDEGNEKLGQHMCGLVQDCNGEVTAEDVYKRLEDIWNEPHLDECSDTAVREVIFWFLRENNVYKDTGE